MRDQGTRPAGEQLVYAGVLEKGMYLGLLVLLATFAVYAFDIVPPAVPRDEISQFWGEDVQTYTELINERYLHLDHPPTGWSWLRFVGKSDFLNFLGIAFLSGVTIVCYLAVVPVFIRKRDFTYAAVALVEVVILALAASGVLVVGH